MIVREGNTLRIDSSEHSNSAAFLKLLTLCRTINDVDEDRDLDEWRQERFIHESADRY